MKTKFLSIAFVLFWCVCSYGQNTIEDYKKIIATTSIDTLKLASLDSLMTLYKRENQLEESANYGEKYVDFAIQLKDYTKATQMTLRLFYLLNTQLGHRERALNLIEKVEAHVDELEDSYLKGGIFIKKAGGYFNGKDYQKSIDYYSKAIELYEDKDSIYIADAVFFRGQAHFETGNFLESMNDYQLASQYYENLGDKEYASYTFASIISIYGANGFTEKAIEERKKLIKKKLAAGLEEGLSVDYYNQYASYKKTDSIKKQEENLLKSLEYAKKFNNSLGNLDFIYVTLARFYLDTDLQKSKEYLDQAKELVEEREKNTLSYQRYQIAEAFYAKALGKHQQAIETLTQVLPQVKKSSDASMIMQIHQELSEAYAAQGDHEKALSSYKTYTQMKDSIFNRTKTNALAYYQTLYETEKKESEIQRQQSAIDVLAAQNKNSRRLMVFGGIGLLLIFLIILLYRNRFYLKKENELRATYSRNLLFSQDAERKRISKDLHDSLGQSLLLVKNKISNQDEDAKELLNNAIEEMRGISRTLYPLQLKELGITSAIHSLVEQIDENSPEVYIFADIDNIDGLLPTEHEINLFRIIQECLSNVIKHAKAKSAKLNVQKQNKKIVMTLQDNGVGFDFLSKFKNLKSLGLKTIKDRVQYIDGILRVESTPGQGSKFKIEIQTA
jgi:signal transduction histidine kinase